MRQIYLDHASTTPVRPEVVEAMAPYFTEHFGNPSSIYPLGQEASDAVAAARESLASLIGATPREIFFSSGGTESDNWALKGFARANATKGRHIITSAIEHHAVLHTCEALEREGFEVTYLPVDEHGLVSVEDFKAAIRPDTILASTMFANNEVGTVEPVEELVRIAHAHGVPIHVDAVQAAGQIPIRFRDWDVDALSVSGHKFGTPKGLGALLVRGRTPIEPVLSGGGQERGLRSGTQNVAGAVALAIGLNESNARMQAQYRELVASRDMLIDAVRRVAPRADLTGDPERRLPGHASFIFPGVTGEALLVDLDARGIAASSGSACAIGRHEIPATLLAMGLEPSIAKSALRMTFRKPLTREQVERISLAIEESYTDLTRH